MGFTILATETGKASSAVGRRPLSLREAGIMVLSAALMGWIASWRFSEEQPR